MSFIIFLFQLLVVPWDTEAVQHDQWKENGMIKDSKDPTGGNWNDNNFEIPYISHRNLFRDRMER